MTDPKRMKSHQSTREKHNSVQMQKCPPPGPRPRPKDRFHLFREKKKKKNLGYVYYYTPLFSICQMFIMATLIFPRC